MTLKELLTGALLQLDRNTDSQTLELWRDKLTRYFNDAILDLTGEIRLRRTDPVSIAEGQIDTALLPRACLKVVSLQREGKRLPFYYGVGTGLLHVPGASDGPAELTYRYLPPELRADTDVPELPPWCHGALIAYVVGRERASGDAMSVNAARACFELYHAATRSSRSRSLSKIISSIVHNGPARSVFSEPLHFLQQTVVDRDGGLPSKHLSGARAVKNHLLQLSWESHAAGHELRDFTLAHLLKDRLAKIELLTDQLRKAADVRRDSCRPIEDRRAL